MESENTLSSDAGSPELQAARPAPNRTLPSPGKEVRLTLSPEAGTADSEPFALCNFISVQLQISVCLQNYIMCHSPSCYSSKPILCTPICLPACLINPQEGRERERGKVFPIAPFSPLLHLRHPSHSQAKSQASELQGMGEFCESFFTQLLPLSEKDKCLLCCVLTWLRLSSQV